MTSELNLFMVQDEDCPTWVVAADWTEALAAWRKSVIDGSPSDWQDGEQPQPLGIQLVCTGSELLLPEGFDRRHAEAAAPPFDGTDMMTVPEIMTVGELLASLGQFQDDNLVRVNGDKLGPLGSYRGDYGNLAFGCGTEGSDIETVGDLRAALRSAQGASFEGYKGGTYRMRAETPVWVSDYGECSGIAVVGLRRAEGSRVVRVLTKKED